MNPLQVRIRDDGTLSMSVGLLIDFNAGCGWGGLDIICHNLAGTTILVNLSAVMELKSESSDTSFFGIVVPHLVAIDSTHSYLLSTNVGPVAAGSLD